MAGGQTEISAKDVCGQDLFKSFDELSNRAQKRQNKNHMTSMISNMIIMMPWPLLCTAVRSRGVLD